ncbi:MAG: serine--tRNA ligase [Candidatus Hydrogenedentes bacterium]|nr:serine--tRNA ligase [Candidatus Hydrogenedentota bacterium]
MIDIKLLRDEPEVVRAALAKRNSALRIEDALETDAKRRALVYEVEQLRAEQNVASEAIGVKKKAREDASDAIAAMKTIKDRIAVLEEQVREVDEALRYALLTMPNIPHDSVPPGASEVDNREVRRWGTPRVFDFEAKDHVDIAEKLGIVDFECGAKLAGARFSLSKGAGARLERALINFMLDVHTQEHGYTEVLPPFMVNSACMEGTGQLPKFASDSFRVENTDYWLIPTAEVPVTNIHRQEILSADALPLYYAAYTPCFRSEAGSYGKDTRGMIRQHQFNKVEMVKLCAPEDSWEELERLTANAETILQRLGLPYRVVTLCAGDLGFSSAKTYDLEVWLPGQNAYREISSCSNFADFQARRANIRFKRDKKPEFVHTINGSGLAVGRTAVAILENYQEADGSVVIPEAIRPYMNGLERIATATA